MLHKEVFNFARYLNANTCCTGFIHCFERDSGWRHELLWVFKTGVQPSSMASTPVDA